MDNKRLRELAGAPSPIEEGTDEQHGSDRLRHLAGLPPINRTQKVIMEMEMEPSMDDVQTKAVDLIDDMLSSLQGADEEHYGDRGDVLRYILQKLQGGEERQQAPMEPQGEEQPRDSIEKQPPMDM